MDVKIVKFLRKEFPKGTYVNKRTGVEYKIKNIAYDEIAKRYNIIYTKNNNVLHVSNVFTFLTVFNSKHITRKT